MVACPAGAVALFAPDVLPEGNRYGCITNPGRRWPLDSAELSGSTGLRPRENKVLKNGQHFEWTLVCRKNH